MLGCFWSKAKVAEWLKEVHPNDTDAGVETAANLITLSKNAHAAWINGDFALKPLDLSGDKTSLTSQFFLQARHPKLIDSNSAMNFHDVPPSTAGLLESVPGSVYLARKLEGSVGLLRQLRSGEIITVKTDDPVRRPLPSIRLLELQWFLQRIMGMAGAADVSDFAGNGLDDGYDIATWNRTVDDVPGLADDPSPTDEDSPEEVDSDWKELEVTGTNGDTDRP